VAEDLPHARERESDLIPDQALAHVPGWAGRSSEVSLARLKGGGVNSSWLVETRAGRFVVRLHSPMAGLLGVDHEREARLHAAAAAAGLAPRLVHVDPQHRLLITEHVDGPSWQPEDFGREDRLRDLAARLRLLHELPAPAVAPFDLPALLERHAERLRQACPQDRVLLDRLMDRAGHAARECRSDLREQAIVHNDLYHANVVGTGPALRLLDWEYAAVADPLFDLACILAYYPQAAPHAAALLEAAGLAERADLDMLARASWLFVLASYFWERLRRLAEPAGPREPDVGHALLRRLQEP